MSVPRFWREIPQRYNLQASKCGVCQRIHFPPREVCPTCRRTSVGKMQPVKLSGRGTILEFTRVHKPAPGYAMQVPYVVALIQSAEGPIITGQVVDSEPTHIVAGAPVHAVFRRLGQDGEDGVIYYGTKWQVDPSTKAKETKEPDAPQETKAPAAATEGGRTRRVLRRKAKASRKA